MRRFITNSMTHYDDAIAGGLDDALKAKQTVDAVLNLAALGYSGEAGLITCWKPAGHSSKMPLSPPFESYRLRSARLSILECITDENTAAV